AVSRDIISGAGFGEYFGHSLGHGVGLDVHEAPSVSARSTSTLSDGDVITVEPGIYLPGLGGIRIEDTVAVVQGGGRSLTTTSTALAVLGEAAVPVQTSAVPRPACRGTHAKENRLMASTADFKNGLVLKDDGNLLQIVEFQHVKPGKGPAFVRTKLKNVVSGKTI